MKDIKINGISVYDNYLIAIILVLAFVKPAFFDQIALLSKVYTWMQFVFTIFLLSISITDKSWTKSIIVIYTFFGTLLLTTILGSGNVYEYCRSFFPTLGMCLIVDLWSKHNVKVLFDAIDVLEIYVYINLFTIFLFPDGMYQTNLYSANWFLGYKNPQIRIILPIVAITLIRTYWNKGKMTFRSYVLIICSMITFILVDSSTAMVGFGAFAILLILFHRKKNGLPRVFTLLNSLIVVSVFFIGIVFWGIQNSFAWLIEGVLGKSLTFTGRMNCWLNAVEYIRKKPVFGYGYLTSDDFVSMLGRREYTHPHNLFLYLGMMGGLLLVIVFIMMIALASMQLKRYSSYIGSKIILFALCCFLIMGLTEAITGTVLFYPMFIMAINVNYMEYYGQKAALENRIKEKRIKFKLSWR